MTFDPIFDPNVLASLNSNIPTAVLALKLDPAMAIQLAQYWHDEIGSLAVFQEYEALTIASEDRMTTVAATLANCNTTWAASPAAQDPKVLAIKSGSGTTVAECCIHNRMWCLSPIAQNKTYLLSNPKITELLAKHSHEWGKLAIAQDEDILSMVNSLKIPIASVLAKHNPDWGASIAATKSSILLLEDAWEKTLVANMLAVHNKKWLMAGCIHSVDLLKARGENGTTVAESIVDNDSPAAAAWMLTKSAQHYDVANITSKHGEPLIFKMLTRLASLNTVLEFGVELSPEVLSLTSKGGNKSAASIIAVKCGERWFDGCEHARSKSILMLKDNDGISVLHTLINQKSLVADKYLKTLVLQGCSADFESDRAATYARQSLSTFNAGRHNSLAETLVNVVFNDTEHLEVGSELFLICVALHSTIINLSNCGVTGSSHIAALERAKTATEKRLLELLENEAINAREILLLAKKSHSGSHEFINRRLSKIEFDVLDITPNEVNGEANQPAPLATIY